MKSIQFLLTCWALEKEFELYVWKKLRKKEKEGETCTTQQFQPVLTRWEHFGQSCRQFLLKRADFKRIAQIILRKSVKTLNGSQIKITTNLIEFISSEELAAMGYFMDGVYSTFWELHFNILKKHDVVSKQFGFVTKNIALEFYFAQKDIELLKMQLHTFTLNNSEIEKNARDQCRN